jgi:hypothetical protein
MYAAAGETYEFSDLNFGVNLDSGANAENLILISVRTEGSMQYLVVLFMELFRNTFGNKCSEVP